MSHSTPELSAPLEGVLVADFSRVLAGPLATMTLADLGAEVIKVERPGHGDDTRQWGPPWTQESSSYFECVNRSKKSITLDLRSPEDVAVARALAARADVVVENFITGTMDRLGLGYTVLSQVNPQLIYVKISSQGATGPERDYGSLGSTLEQTAGLVLGDGAHFQLGQEVHAGIQGDVSHARPHGDKPRVIELQFLRHGTLPTNLHSNHSNNRVSPPSQKTGLLFCALPSKKRSPAFSKKPGF